MKTNALSVQSPVEEQSGGAEAVVDSFMASLSSATHETSPYDYWLIGDILPESVVERLNALPFAIPEDMDFAGRREVNNKLRVYFSPENQEKYPVCAEIADAFKDQRVLDLIEKVTGSEVSKGQLRIEYCQDTNGFWLEPHVDVSVKLFSMMVYLSDDPALRNAGTDIYDDTPEHNLVVSAPYDYNKGMIFIPAHNTWHGFSKRPVNGVRKSLIINYVTTEWRATEELA